MKAGVRLQKYLDDQAIFKAQTTGPIKLPTKHTDKLPKLVEPPVSKVIPLANVQAVLVNLTDVSHARVLQGFRLAYLHQRIALTDALYVVRDVYADLAHPEKIYARLEREDG